MNVACSWRGDLRHSGRLQQRATGSGLVRADGGQITWTGQSEKQALLTLKLRQGLADQSIDRAGVHPHRKHGADRVVRHLATAGVNAARSTATKCRPSALRCFRKGYPGAGRPTSPRAGSTFRGEPCVQLQNAERAEQYVRISPPRAGRTASRSASSLPMKSRTCAVISNADRREADASALPEDFQKGCPPAAAGAQVGEMIKDARRDEARARGRGSAGDAKRGVIPAATGTVLRVGRGMTKLQGFKRDDRVIFVHIDNNEQAYLKV